MIGVFARPDHPAGYGFVQEGHFNGRAHGYVTIFVRCKSRKQLVKVSERLTEYNNPFHGVKAQQYSFGYMGDWYGGRFELIAIFPGNNFEHVLPYVNKYGEFTPVNGDFCSRGDNRFTGIYEADDVLEN